MLRYSNICKLLGRLSLTNPLMTNSSTNNGIKAGLLIPFDNSGKFHVSRNYTIGEYDKMTYGAGGTSGIGRANRPKLKRTVEDDKHSKFGRMGVEFNALHKPLGPTIQDDEKAQATVKKIKWDRRLRGWSGKTWPGRYAGVPQGENGDNIDGFRSVVFEVKRIKNKSSAPKIQAIVVVGNGNGLLGWAKARKAIAIDAILKARNVAALNLIRVPMCDEHSNTRTIYHDLDVKWYQKKMQFYRKPPGFGIRSQRMTKEILELAGITDCRVRLIGRVGSKINHIKTVFHALQAQETHSELAERVGKIVVEKRSNQGYRPIVVARPSAKAIERRVAREIEDPNYDFLEDLEPEQAHRMKQIDAVRGGVRYAGEEWR